MLTFPAVVKRVVDGDTYDVFVDVRHFDPERPDWYPRIRCAFYNAPERSVPGGSAATAWLAALLPAGKEVTLVTFGRDVFRRLVAETYIGGMALSEMAIQSGHGSPTHFRQQIVL